MKYIKRIDELQKSTYVSAAKKLKNRHRGRSEDLIKYAREKGEPKKIDRIYPHIFKFTNKSVGRFSDELHPDENFFISNIKHLGLQQFTRKTGYEYYITFESNYNNKIMIRLVVFKDGEMFMKLNQITINDDIQIRPSDDFEFITRKDAFHFKRAICETIEDESPDSEELEIFKSASINQMYTTN